MATADRAMTALGRQSELLEMCDAYLVCHCTEPNEAIVQRRLIDALANAVPFLTDSQTEQLLNFLVVEIGDRGSFGLPHDHLSRLSPIRCGGVRMEHVDDDRDHAVASMGGFRPRRAPQRAWLAFGLRGLGTDVIQQKHEPSKFSAGYTLRTALKPPSCNATRAYERTCSNARPSQSPRRSLSACAPRRATTSGERIRSGYAARPATAN